jgi:hypothetical protein
MRNQVNYWFDGEILRRESAGYVQLREAPIADFRGFDLTAGFDRPLVLRLNQMVHNARRGSRAIPPLAPRMLATG